jgi:hypothetical protein
LHRAFTPKHAIDAETGHVVQWPICNDGIDAGCRYDVRELCGIEIGRTKHEATGDTIHLYERNRGGELVIRPEEDRSTAKLAEAAAERGATGKIRKDNVGVGGPERTMTPETGVT